MTVWDDLADAKTPLRAAWDDDRHDQTLRHVDWIDGQMRWDLTGPVFEIGAGPGRLTLPLAQRHPDRDFIAYDTSPKMLEPLAAAGQPNVWVWPEGLGEIFAGVYSMLTLQHVDDSEARRLLELAADILMPRARALIQFSTPTGPDDHGPLSHPRQPEDIARLTRDLFATRALLPDPIEPAWLWFVGIARP